MAQSGTLVGTWYPHEVGGGPIIPPGQPPVAGWPPVVMPPIYIPVPPPEGGAPGVPTHPIFIPVYPTHPIVIPQPPPDKPVVWPPLPGGIPPVGGYPGYPAPPLGIWGGGNVPMPNPPIYIPAPQPPGEPGVPTQPIYLPVYPAHPIVLPPEGGEPPKPELPPLPPEWVAPPTGARFFWAYSPGYNSMVAVPYAGVVAGELPHVEPRR